jgi:hypothetical protein
MPAGIFIRAAFSGIQKRRKKNLNELFEDSEKIQSAYCRWLYVLTIPNQHTVSVLLPSIFD